MWVLVNYYNYIYIVLENDVNHGKNLYKHDNSNLLIKDGWCKLFGDQSFLTIICFSLDETKLIVAYPIWERPTR